ncbi:hypothetical protein [Haloprofundus halobius]|uniref:hypothetical protein n=1 Tax=Haloprofundus halobius TaxID=2876194 RepID=UPI001CCD06C1|nr:hypothetical protein [Haloprofundus halobius]
MGEYADFEYRNKPEPQVIIQPVGEEPSVTWVVDFPEQGAPRPEQFAAIGAAEIKLLTSTTEFDGELREKADAAHDALVELQKAMCDARGLDDEARKEVILGNLDALPEVEKR